MSGFKRRANPADLTAQLEKVTGGDRNFDDASEWKLSTDKVGNGSAVIRFLPPKTEEDLPFVKIFTHGFKHNGRWFIENCPTTIGRENCPCCSANSELWNTGTEENQNIVRQRKRKQSFWANIVVIKDESCPENVGKVFKYRFGQKILDKITGAATPNFDLGTKGMDVTCVFEGANFLLKCKKVSGFPNYDDSTFGPSSELFDGDEDKLTEVWNQMHDLNAIIAPEQFLSEAEMKSKLNKVIGQSEPMPSAESQLDSTLNDLQQSTPANSTVADSATSDDELDALLDGIDLS